MSTPVEDTSEFYGSDQSLEEWLELHGLDPEAEVSGELFETLPENIQQQYEIKHGTSEDASGDSVFMPQQSEVKQ